MGSLLDTNVISEIRKTPCDTNVLRYMQNIALDNVYISVFTMGEIRRYINRLSTGKKKTELLDWYHDKLCTRFRRQIIPVNLTIIETWSDLTSTHPRTLPFIDSILAATCLAEDLTLVTRNTRDFQDIAGLKLLNPWIPG